MRSCRNPHLNIQAGFALHTVRTPAHDTKDIVIARACLLNTQNRPFSGTVRYCLVSFFFVLLLYCFSFFNVCVLQYCLYTYICKEAEDRLDPLVLTLWSGWAIVIKSEGCGVQGQSFSLPCDKCWEVWHSTLPSNKHLVRFQLPWAANSGNITKISLGQMISLISFSQVYLRFVLFCFVLFFCFCVEQI